MEFDLGNIKLVYNNIQMPAFAGFKLQWLISLNRPIGRGVESYLRKNNLRLYTKLYHNI